MTNAVYRNAEPVPPASQLAVLPFLAGIDGLYGKMAMSQA